MSEASPNTWGAWSAAFSTSDVPARWAIFPARLSATFEVASRPTVLASAEAPSLAPIDARPSPAAAPTPPVAMNAPRSPAVSAICSMPERWAGVRMSPVRMCRP